jgi:hypothetical protein
MFFVEYFFSVLRKDFVKCQKTLDKLRIIKKLKKQQNIFLKLGDQLPTTVIAISSTTTLLHW